MVGVSVLIRDAAREVRGSQEQMLWERRRKAKDRLARERAKNLCCVVVGTAIVFVFLVVYISDEWLRASAPDSRERRPAVMAGCLWCPAWRG
jgi:hypothetical protein